MRSCSYHHPTPKSNGADVKESRQILSVVTTQLKPPPPPPTRLMEYASFITGCKHTCSLLQGRHYLYYIGKYKICPLPRRDTVALSSKGSCYTNILGKRVWNKRVVPYRMCGNMTHRGTSLPTLLLSENTVPSPLLVIPYSSRKSSLLPLLCPTILCKNCKYFSLIRVKVVCSYFSCCTGRSLRVSITAYSSFMPLTPTSYTASPRRASKIMLNVC